LSSQPEAQRKPAGHELSFLENYRPNINSFLSNEEKQKLAEWGNTINEEQPAGPIPEKY
jgi:hypothetical protein